MTTGALFVLHSALSLRAPAAAPRPASDHDSAAVVAVALRAFDAMARRYTAALRALFIPGTQLVSVQARDSAPVVRIRTDSAFRAGFATGTDKYLERMWKPTVLIRGSIATV